MDNPRSDVTLLDMETVITDGLRKNCLLPFGIDEKDAIAVVEHPEQSEAAAMSEETDTLALFAGRPNPLDPTLVLLISGRLAEGVFKADMAFRIPPDIAGPTGGMNSPLRMFKGLAEQFGLPIVIGDRIERFFAGERVPVRAVEKVNQPNVQNPGDVPYMLSWLARPVVHADCDLCFAIDLTKYKQAIGIAPPPSDASAPAPQSGQGGGKISIVLGKEVQEMMRRTGIRFERAGAVINEHDSALLLSTENPNSTVLAIRWFDDGQIVFIQAHISKSRREGTLVTVETVTAAVVLALRPDLPGGKLERDAQMASIFPLIARSFGVPVVCHPDIGPAKFQSGPWDGKVPHIVSPSGDPIMLSGEFNPTANTCECVWAFSPKFYYAWQSSGPTPGGRSG
ncbi:MAG TPA: hypothetical protein VFC78_14250 [Tepidisphaeraceae bacterium]|nr:hypothetical protein [Tepidisphaeraceae bacterium]